MAASTLSIHSRQRAASGKSASSTSRSSPLSSPAARRRAHRPYSRKLGRPESSRTAPSATSRSNSRRAARSVIDACRAASADATQSSASRRSTTFWAGLARSLGATASRVSERRERSAARSRAEAAASAIAPAAVFDQAGSPGLGRRPPGRPQTRIQNLRRDQGQGRGPAQPDGEDEVSTQRASISASAAGASGKAEKTSSAALAAAETGSRSLGELQARREALRIRQPRSRRAAASVIRPGSRPGGRPAKSRHSRSSFAARPGLSPVAKRRSRSAAASALRRRILAQGRGAQQSEAGAERPGVRRVAAQAGVEQSQAGAGGEQGFALPCPSARPRPGRDRRRWRKRLPFRGIRRARLRSRAPRRRRCAPS